MQLPNEVPQPLNTSHQVMCKFRNYEDPSYIKVMQSIRELMNYTTSQRLPGLFARGKGVAMLTCLGLLANAQFSTTPGFPPPGSTSSQAGPPAPAGTPFSSARASSGD